MKDSNTDQKIKSENILLLSCLRTERKMSEHIVHVRWKRGEWVKARDHDILRQALTCYVGNGWVGACAQKHFGIKQLNGLSADPQNSKDFVWAFVFFLPSFPPWFHPFIHLFIHPHVDSSILIPIHRNKWLITCSMPSTVLGAENVR